MKLSFKLRNPFKNPLNLKHLQQRFFGGKKQRRKLSWKKVGIVALWTFGILVLSLVFLFAWFAKDLPTPNKIKDLVSVGSTRLYDRNMKPLYTISGDKKRIIVSDSEIPQVVKDATIALEDRNFYHHKGISLRGTIRAVLVDLLHQRKSQGGSTITQQLVSNTILNKQKSFTRKIKEAILAIEMEYLYSKDQILTMYLNQIPYGGNNYGIEAASRSFFGKSAKDLTLDEAATLAALPQQPSTLSPYGTNVDKLIARRNYDLDIMADQGYITKAQATQAKTVTAHFSAQKNSITAPHFVLYVKDWLVNFFTDQLHDEQAAEQKVEEGGLSVVTTLDLDKQMTAEDIVSKSASTTLKKANASNAGLVTIDPTKGEIIAMVGSVDYFQPQFGNFNIATAERQPGSSIKPIVYAAAFKGKLNPAFNLFDLKTDFGNYTPENFDGRFRGPLSIRQALGNSLNIPAVKVLALTGIDQALSTAHDMGITTLNDKNRYGLSLVLGGGEVKLVDMATAYGVFANNGTLVPTTPVLKINDNQGKNIYDHTNPTDAHQVLDPQIAYEISNILSDTNAKKPTFSNVMNVLTLANRPVAVKTGTTNAFRDAWTIGYTPQYVTAVWAGNNDNTPMNHAGGSVAAAPIWDAFMEKLHQNLPVVQFAKPAGIQDVTVDKLSNKLPVDGSDVTTDIFASWQVPTEKDDVHVKLAVCRENGLLADSSIPTELTELRTYTNIHSEMPNNPKWENPVQAWAKANGFNNPPPTSKCSSGGTTNPAVNITSPNNNANVSGDFQINADASAPSGVKSVEFLIDNSSISVDSSSPYAADYNASQLSGGSHTISAILTSNNGSTVTDTITVNVSKDTTPPSNITNFNYTPGSPGSGQVTLSWTNPSDSDFKSVKIYIYQPPNSGSPDRVVEQNKPGQNVVITGLTVGKQYKFRAKSTDTAGNESSGVDINAFIL